MAGDELLKMADELDAHYRDFDGCVARSEGCQWLRVYARGQLGPIERKSLEPIADAEGVAPRTLQWFFLRNGWDEDRVLAVHQRPAAFAALRLGCGGIGTWRASRGLRNTTPDSHAQAAWQAVHGRRTPAISRTRSRTFRTPR